jgi:para-aminobenzoate synthetase/4-amino-4-deoxychorismate lyase
MQIIREIERTPRGVYTGCAGVLGPGRRGWMNVAIRTLVVDRRHRAAEYGTGSGIVWDARAGAEFDECRTKTLVLGGLPPPFRLIETLAWTPGDGLLLLERHLRRIGDSAEYFGFVCDTDAIRTRLAEATRGLSHPRRVRLLLDEQGGIEVAAVPLGLRTVSLSETPPPRRSARAVRVRVAQEPVRRSDVYLYHKTTRRQVYERALADVPGCDDVILTNDEGEVTESTTANVVVRDEQGCWTPPVECGLLAGTFRGHLLERGAIRERRITLNELGAAKEVWLINSVRGWRLCRLRDGRP